MISAARLAANRANAQKSTGPRTAAGKQRAAQNARRSTGPTTAAGKQRSARNARRHGLTLPASREPGGAQTIAALAHAIAEPRKGPQVLALALAMQVAAAQVDIMRARRARLALLAGPVLDNIRRLAAIERYERRARNRRYLAIRAFDLAQQARRPPPDAQRPDCQNEPNPT